ncbi:MAG: nitrogenase component 1 [Candidatus Woesearchaeota archaeon]
MKKMKKNTSGQHCCSLHGWITCLMRNKIDFPVILHSDINCSNLVFKGDSDVNTLGRFFCTNLSEENIIKGDGTKRLEECIDAVIGEEQPRDILILNSCMSQIIGDDVKGTVQKKRGKSRTRIHYRETTGLVFEDPKKVIDDVGYLILETLKNDNSLRDDRERRTINIIGFENYVAHNKNDLRGYDPFLEELRKAGAKINTTIGPGSPISDWKKSLKADININFDRRLYQNVAEIYSKKHNIKTIEVPFPAGIKQTLEFFGIVNEKLGAGKDIISNLEKEIKEAEDYLEKHKNELKKKKIIYNIASNLDFTIGNSAKEGLLMLDFFKELGCDVEILIQGNPEEEHRLAVKNTLQEIGIEDDFTLFGHCGDGYKFIDGSSDTIVYGSPLLKEQAERMGNRFIHYGEILPGLMNMKHNIDIIIGKDGY